MKSLAHTLWLAATVVFVWGCWLAFSASKTEAALFPARSVQPGHLENPAPAHSSLRSQDRAGSIRSESVQPWKYTQPTPEERKAMFANALPNSPAARAAQDGIRVRLHYHALYEKLGLTQQQIAQFETAMAGNFKADVFTPLVGQSPEDTVEWYAHRAQGLDEVVRDTLGEAAVAQVRDFVATKDLRDFADKLAVNTFATETPLTARQADQLVEASMANRTTPGSGLRNNPADVDWDRTLQQAEMFLSPAQLTALRAMTDILRFDRDFKNATGLPYRSQVRNF